MAITHIESHMIYAVMVSDPVMHFEKDEVSRFQV